MDSQIFFDNNLIHPETNSDVVIHNNSNLKNFLNGLISTDNMPAFMQSFLMSQDYIAANQALHTIPETYFDYAFNKWTASGSPTVSGGVCTFAANSFLQSTPGWTLGAADFTVDIRFNTSALNGVLFCEYNTAGSNPNRVAYIQTSGKIVWTFWDSSGNAHNILSNSSISINSWNHLELSFDSSDNTRRLFINGLLDSSNVYSIPKLKSFRIGDNHNSNNKFNGSIDYIHISDCVRHTSDFTPQTPTFDDNTLSLLLFDQVITMDFLQYLPNLSFVEIVCLYLLFDVKKSLNKLSTAIDKLSDKVDKIDRLENEIRELKFKVDKLF